MLAPLAVLPAVIGIVAAATGVVPGAIGVVAPAGPDEGCPSPRQVTDALGARLPGAVLPVGQPAGTSAFKLIVATDSAGVTRVDLADPGGELLLHRTLAAPERPKSGECPALADTVALIVERYWREVGFDVPPLPPPRPAAAAPASPSVTEPALEERPTAPSGPFLATSPHYWSVAAAIGGRGGDTGNVDVAAGIALGAQRSWGGLRLSGGISPATTADATVGTASFRRFPFRLGGYWPLRVGIGQLEPGLGVGLEVISVGLSDVKANTHLVPNSLCSGRFCVSPEADISMGWSIRSVRHLYLRVLTRAGLAVPYAFGPNGEIWSTPRTYLGVGLESGIWFN